MLRFPPEQPSLGALANALVDTERESVNEKIKWEKNVRLGGRVCDEGTVISEPLITSSMVPSSLIYSIMMTTKLSKAAAEECRSDIERSLGPVVCKSGCTHCCEPKIIITTGEGIIIAAYLAQTKTWAGMAEKLVEADRLMTEEDHDLYYERRKPCLFLEDGRCSIYPVRPFACIATHSINPDCSRAGGDGADLVYTARPNPPFIALIDLYEAVELYFTGKPMTLHTLPGAVLMGGHYIAGKSTPRLAVIGINEQPHVEAFDRHATRRKVAP